MSWLLERYVQKVMSGQLEPSGQLVLSGRLVLSGQVVLNGEVGRGQLG